MKSFTYYLTILVIKLKGLKRLFSQNPIDYKAVRKGDVLTPKGTFFKNNTHVFSIHKSTITEIKPIIESAELVILIHGGAFISGPAQHHWDVAKEISKKTGHIVWMCNYPKAPECQIGEISENIDEVYEAALARFNAKSISLIGDSAGGTLVTALVQRVVKKSIALPRQIILISPVMDATISNPSIVEVDKVDLMLSKDGVLSAKRLCAGSESLSDARISPLNGSFANFPTTVMFIATNDITYPDQKLAIQKMDKANVNLQVVIGREMPHIWPFLPVMKEAKVALNQIIDLLTRK